MIKVDEQLLNQISEWVLYNRLGALARNLALSQAENSRIAIATNQPEEQIYGVSFILIGVSSGSSGAQGFGLPYPQTSCYVIYRKTRKKPGAPKCFRMYYF